MGRSRATAHHLAVAGTGNGRDADAAGSDGGRLDALVLTVEATYPGIWVAARPIGVFWIRVEDRREAKLVCVPDGEPAYAAMRELDELAEHLRAEISNIFDIYRSLDPESDARPDGHQGAEAARAVLANGGHHAPVSR